MHFTHEEVFPEDEFPISTSKTILLPPRRIHTKLRWHKFQLCCLHSGSRLDRVLEFLVFHPNIAAAVSFRWVFSICPAIFIHCDVAVFICVRHVLKHHSETLRVYDGGKNYVASILFDTVTSVVECSMLS